jgi:hypothetical protein
MQGLLRKRKRVHNNTLKKLCEHFFEMGKMGLTPKYYDSGVQFTEIYCISLIMISVKRFVVLQDSYLVHVSPGKNYLTLKW